MNERTLRLLEFDTIRSRVADCALSAEAADRIREDISPREASAVRELKALAGIMLERIQAGDEKQESLPSIAPLFPVLETEGAVLEIEDAFALGLFAGRGGAFVNWLLKGDENPVLKAATDGMPDCLTIAQEVFRIIDKDGNLRDLACFREIKRRIQNLTRDLEHAGSKYTSNEELRRMLQSGVPSQRDGRMVLAVKANFRGRIRGIVHEVSATGQTLFVEPEEVVEKNNELIIEKQNLEAEIRKALRTMTKSIAEHRDKLIIFHEKVVWLETIRARARYSSETRGRFALEDPGSLVLVKARHPLLSHPVPIDIAMEGDTRVVIITGPNTGGKTVALKTAGLFALMNQFGLALPAEEGTILPIFDGIYADIGDEQSLSQSLSTFSAHMTNIASILEVSGASSLVLLDELGSGTDPAEGSAVAMAILDCLIEKKTRLITTTHHGILKNYGYTREGVENASMEFDGRSLSPTYRIIMGLPGESHALDIAGRNGLAQGIVERARGYLDDGRSDISALISGLKKKHEELDAAGAIQQAEDLRLREERRRADLRELRLKQKELEIKTVGAGQLRRLLDESRKTLENLVREVREGELTREKTRKVKEFLKVLEERAEAEEALLEEAEQQLALEKSRIEDGGSPETEDGGAFKGRIPQTIEPGIEVLAGEFKRRARVLRQDKKGSWLVEIGSLKMKVDGKDLVPLAPSGEEIKPVIAAADLAAAPRPQFELNVLGMRLEEALDSLRRQIDAAVLGGMGEFSVIHGKGDGILQKGVHQYLRDAPQVADYFFSRPEMGGFGRTEVILK
ncbi:MAG: Smr/MutS family protein [Treponema sp.]|jgi:DNA mismatch repair protein MutS2|nr:Smr/MutS family protein [Treponema sp.]